MYRDIKVISFDTDLCCGEILHPSMLPMCCKDETDGWIAVRIFCGLRVLLMNRKYSKEILCSCNLSDQSDIAICIASNALSFRDNYWIKEESSSLQWRDVNLYDNEFNKVLPIVSLTGKQLFVNINEKLFTGELTAKGTRAKCFLRMDSKIFLVKAETNEEIASEIIAYEIASCFKIDCTKYASIYIYDRDCSICNIQTNSEVEFIPCSDVMKKFHDVSMNSKSDYFRYFIETDKINFLRMILFDYITLNTDRNRDNFGLKRCHGIIQGMYPLFDHDSCFKGINTDANYFVTGMSFKDSLSFVANLYPEEFATLRQQFSDGLQMIKSDSFRSLFLLYKSEFEYDGLIQRIKDVVGEGVTDRISAF